MYMYHTPRHKHTACHLQNNRKRNRAKDEEGGGNWTHVDSLSSLRGRMKKRVYPHLTSPFLVNCLCLFQDLTSLPPFSTSVSYIPPRLLPVTPSHLFISLSSLLFFSRDFLFISPPANFPFPSAPLAHTSPCSSVSTSPSLPSPAKTFFSPLPPFFLLWEGVWEQLPEVGIAQWLKRQTQNTLNTQMDVNQPRQKQNDENSTYVFILHALKSGHHGLHLPP